VRRGTALVTGASGGFGAHVCAGLVVAGYRVLASMRDTARADAVRQAVAARHFDPDDPRSLQIVRLDVDDPQATRALADRVLAEGTPVDVLVNNAGIMVEGFAEELDEAELRRLFETNFFAVTRLTRTFVGPMRERRQGRVINVSSIGGRFATPGYAAYHATKFALEGWSEALRYELAPFNVFVSLVEPGLFPTEIFGDKLQRLGPGASGKGPYGRVWSRLRAASERALQLADGDPGQVGDLVARIAISRRPRLRHPIGIDAWVSTALGAPLMTRIWEGTVNRWART
jgi:NAD(P)-dependent dehydrogenase (short-subunit alcohol dehydrogenase family)